MKKVMPILVLGLIVSPCHAYTLFYKLHVQMCHGTDSNICSTLIDKVSSEDFHFRIGTFSCEASTGFIIECVKKDMIVGANSKDPSLKIVLPTSDYQGDMYFIDYKYVGRK